MTPNQPTRRTVVAGAILAASSAAAIHPTTMAAMNTTDPVEPFGYCLNTSTIRGANLTIVEAIEVAAKVGFTAVEPWISEIVEYQKKGGALADLNKRLRDLGLTVADAIGFDEWIVDDEARRAKGLENLKIHMDLVAQIGGKHIAAPPIGAQKATDPELNLHQVAERYRAVLELGQTMGVQPLVEMWGPSRNLHRLSEVAFVAIEARHPNASMLLDIYHLHRGGSDFEGLKLLNGADLHIIHTNDYPDHPVAELTDAMRVYPGDGVAPLNEIFQTLHATGFRGYLSLELFNHDYWKMSPLKSASVGIAKMKTAVSRALQGTGG